MIAAMLKNISMQTLAQVWKILRNVAVLLRKGPFLRFMDYVEVARVLRVCALAATTFFLTLSSVTSALGHPHMWLDLESRFCLICGFLSGGEDRWNVADNPPTQG